MARGEKGPPPVYECHPPSWLPRTHLSADLGYVGFFPPCPDQEEEVLTEANVKNGLHQGAPIPLETYSARETVRTRLVSENALTELQDLMNQIIVRNAEENSFIPPSTFRLPSRVTLNDAKRQAWFADLANPEVPLQKLGKNVPHGAKGHDLLDLLHSHNVAIPRAVWFLRVFGANETVGLRNKPHYNPNQYSVDWANLVTAYLRKQLTEIALPMAPRPGLNIKQTFKGVLSEPDSRERWLARFTYSLNLLRAFYAEGLVDSRIFLAWLVQQTATCNLAQLGFVARMADEYLDGMLVCRALTRPFVEACLTRIAEIRTTPGSDYLANLDQLLTGVTLRVLLVSPAALVNPRAWTQHCAILEDAVAEYLAKGKTSSCEQSTQALDQAFSDSLEDIRRRNNSMLFRDLPARVLGMLSSALADIKLLNSLTAKSDLKSVVFFDQSSDDISVFTRKLDILLTWAVTPLQYGDHRSYAAVSLLSYWRHRAEERALRRGRHGPDQTIQDQLFDWLDSSDVAADTANLCAVSLLFGQFIKHGLFSYTQYVQRLIARGEQGLLVTEQHKSRHHSFLQWIPLHSSSPALIGQRKLTLYGARAREMPEDIKERAIRKKIRNLLPELFGGVYTPFDMKTDILSSCGDLFLVTRFEQIRLMHSWLLPVLKKAIAAQEQSFDLNDPVLKAYCISTIVMARCRCYGTMLELTLFTLEHASTNELLTAVIRTLRQHTEAWACMNRMQTIISALFAAHTVWKTRGVQSRPLLTLLIELDDGRLLEQAAREQVLADHTAFIYALHPMSDHPETVPAALPEILLLATDPSPDAPSTLANALWYKYRSASDWAWKVWDNTVASLRQIPLMIDDIVGRRACSTRYAIFLTHVDQHLPAGFDEQILSWCLGSGRNEIIALSADAWDVLMIVLLYLSIHGALGTTTILTGLIYPIWSMAASLTAAQTSASMDVLLKAANTLCDYLLLQDHCVDGLPPANLYEMQGLQTRRRDVFRHPHFISLAENMPTLALIQHNANLPAQLREDARVLRISLCSRDVFRLGLYRDLDAVHRAFDRVLGDCSVPEEYHEALIDALKFMFSEDRDGHIVPREEWQIFTVSLSPWKLAATSIELRFTIKQLGDALTRDASRDKARQCLSRLTSSLFGQGMSSEEVDFVAEMVKGARSEVIGHFIDAGLRRIAEIFKERSRPRQISDYSAILRGGEVLRFLTNVAVPLKDDATASLSLDTRIQKELVQEIQDELKAAREVLHDACDGDVETSDSKAIGRTVVLLARILQFTLGLPALWTQQMRMSTIPTCSLIMDLLMYYGSGQTLDIVIFPILIDTLYYLLDEIPLDLKATPFDPFHNYPKLELQHLPSDMPSDYRSRLRVLVPFVAQNASVSDLAYIGKDAAASEGSPIPAQNRPWEWTEYLGERSAVDEKNADDGHVIKNSASLSLELFGARAAGKRVNFVGAEKVDSLLEGTLIRLHDASYGESVFKRDWRESRLEQNSLVSESLQRTEESDQLGPLPTFGATSTEHRTDSRMGSPASSIRSRSSVQPMFTTSLRQSPQSQAQRMSGSAASEVIDVDSLDMSATTSLSHQGASKRKASDDPSDEEEIQILQGPVIASQKKQKGKVTKLKKR